MLSLLPTRPETMTLAQLLNVLSGNPGCPLQVQLPDGSSVPAHFHVTEVGLVHKDFIDCGGTVRSTSACVLQVWVANDLDHRLNSSRLGHILNLGAPILKTTDLPVEIEYEHGMISQYPLNAVDVTAPGIVFRLGSKHTACLAPDLCGVVEDRGCCSSSGCC